MSNCNSTSSPSPALSLTRHDLDALADQADRLADALNYLAETAQDAGLRCILISLSNEASKLVDQLRPSPPLLPTAPPDDDELLADIRQLTPAQRQQVRAFVHALHSGEPLFVAMARIFEPDVIERYQAMH